VVALWCRFAQQHGAFFRSATQDEIPKLFDLQSLAVCGIFARLYRRPYQGCALTTDTHKPCKLFPMPCMRARRPLRISAAYDQET
jgi:hypothetical protein